MEKPESRPDWQIGNNDPNKNEEPDAAQKLSGFIRGQALTSRTLNWLLANMSEWIAFFETSTGQAPIGKFGLLSQENDVIYPLDLGNQGETIIDPYINYIVTRDRIVELSFVVPVLDTTEGPIDNPYFLFRLSKAPRPVLNSLSITQLGPTIQLPRAAPNAPQRLDLFAQGAAIRTILQTQAPGELFDKFVEGGVCYAGVDPENYNPATGANMYFGFTFSRLAINQTTIGSPKTISGTIRYTTTETLEEIARRPSDPVPPNITGRVINAGPR